jgi:mono/diheme cytochrome c family protein
LLGLALLFTAAILAFAALSAQAQTPDPAKLEEGARLFAANCAVCHGPHGEGRVGATLAKNWPSIRPDLTVKNIIENGVQGSVMPAWSEKNGGILSESEIDALVYYILSWQTGGFPQIPSSPTPAPRPAISPVPNVSGDPNHGALLFDQNCVVCHGPNGEGRIGEPLAKDWPSVRPDLLIKNTIQNGVQGSVMPAWSQTNGGPLTDENINDLVAFILSRPRNVVFQITATAPAVSPVSVPALSGWWGVVLFFVLFVVIVAGAIIVQRRV